MAEVALLDVSKSYGAVDAVRNLSLSIANGEFVVLSHDHTPKHLLWPGNTAQHLVASSERIRKELGYRELLPREEAIRRTIAWERAHPPAQPLAQFDYAAEDETLEDRVIGSSGDRAI